MIVDLISAAQQQDWNRARELLYQHWLAECPKQYAVDPDKPWDGPQLDQSLNSSLFSSLAGAICGDSSMNNGSLAPLNVQAGITIESSKAGQICGHVFKCGELTYTCKDCATDSTCVMCRECFQNSIHKEHKHKIHTSSGSGYCDCGDKDAWKTGYACTVHARTLDSDRPDSPSVSIPPELDARLFEFFTIILQYVNTLICWKDRDSLPDYLKKLSTTEDEPILSQPSQPYMTVLYNDETHTYESVIRALEMFIHCSPQQAMMIATIVDREGRSCVKIGAKTECDRVKIEIQRRTARDSNRRTEKNGPLDVKVMESSLIAHQNHAIILLTWLNQQIEKCPILSLILGRVLLEIKPLEFDPSCDTDEPEPSVSADCIAEQFLKWDKHMWKASRLNVHEMFMKTLLMHYDQKVKFAKLFLKMYHEIYADFISDDHELDVSVVSLTVQFLTVPGIARLLIEEDNALREVFRALNHHVAPYQKVKEGTDVKYFDFASRPFPAVLKRAMHMMRDQIYMLNAIPSVEQFTEKLKQNFVIGFEMLVDFLHNMQGMDEVKRQQMEHQVWDLEWETAFNIQLRIQDMIGLIMEWIAVDKDVHKRCFVICLDAIFKHPVTTDGIAGSTHSHISLNGDEGVCLSFDVLSSPVSVHQPLHRLAAGFFATGENFLNFLHDQSIVKTEIENDIALKLTKLGQELYEMPLRVLVLCAQVNAQLWRRNGFSLVNQIHNYNSPLCRSEMFDKDILMLQAGAALKDPVQFTLHLLVRFRLKLWAGDIENNADQAKADLSGKYEPEETSKIIVALAEDMLHLVINICGERNKPGVGKCMLEDHVRREVIHILCMGPHPFSQIVRKMPQDPRLERVSLQDIVNSVANFKKPTSTSAGQFHLREDLLVEYNPFFYHYSKSDLSMAEKFQQKLRLKMDRSIVACPPPSPGTFVPFFEPVVQLLKCRVLVRLCRIIMDRTSKRSRYSSDRLLHRVLYLIGMGLQEQKKNTDFDYLTVAEEFAILKTMEGLVGTTEVAAHSDLLWWTIQKYKEVDRMIKNTEEVTHEVEEPAQESAEDRKKKKALMAAKMREQALKRMKKMQSTFLKVIEKDTPMDTVPIDAADVKLDDCRIDDDEDYAKLSSSDFPVALGVHKSKLETVLPRKVTCMLCQEEELLQPGEGKAFVCAAYVQRSFLFAQKDIQESQPPVREMFVPATLSVGTDASTCSHTMHYECYLNLSEAQLARERNRPRQQMAFNQKMVDPEVGEYLCPLCKRLSNSAMPVLPAYPLMKVDGFSSISSTTDSFDDWMEKVVGLLEAPPAASQKPVKSHSRKRSHSERSLMDLAKQDDLSNMPLENTLSTSVPSASTMSVLMDSDGALKGSSSDVDFSADDLVLFLAEGEQARNALTSPSVSQDETRRTTKTPTTSFSLSSAIAKLPGLTLLLKTQKIISPSYEMYGDMMKSFTKMLSKTRGRKAKEDVKETFEDHCRGYFSALSAWQSTAHVLRSISTILEIENKPLFGAFNTRQRDCIHAMSRLCGSMCFVIQHIPEHTTCLLRILLTKPTPVLASTTTICPTSPKSPAPSKTCPTSPTVPTSPTSTVASDSVTASKLLQSPLVQFFFSTKTSTVGSGMNLLHVDTLSLSISLCMSVGWMRSDGTLSLKRPRKEHEMLPDGSVDEQYCLRICLLANFFQVFSSFYDSEMCEASDEDVEVDSRLKELWQICRPYDVPLIDASALRKKLRKATLCFLRPMGLFYHGITLIPPPEALKDPSVDEFEPLCRYLGLPHSFHLLLDGEAIEKLFKLWSYAIPADPLQREPVVDQPIRSNLLIALPEDFSDVIERATAFKCPTVPFEETVTNVPTLCLVCGTILCSQSYCCQKTVGKESMGACRYHMIKCSGPMGAFLRIRDCTVVLMTNRERGCFRPAPYVDEFGEVDQGFRRGNPLHLNPDLYQKIRQIWLSQGITEEVVNQYEIDHRNMQYDWAHF